MMKILPKFASTHKITCSGDEADTESCTIVVGNMRQVFSQDPEAFAAFEHMVNPPEVADAEDKVVFCFHNDGSDEVFEYESVDDFQEKFPIFFSQILKALLGRTEPLIPKAEQVEGEGGEGLLDWFRNRFL